MNPRIEPIEKPKGLLRRMMYALLRKAYGKVITPAKVIYARYPKIGRLVKTMDDIGEGFDNIPVSERVLIQHLVSALNGCSFCMDLAKRKSIDKNIGLDKFRELEDFSSSEKYSRREKAVFAYVREMTEQVDVSDETYDTLQEYCSDEEIIEVTYIAASENYLNRLTRPLKIGSDELCEIR